MSARRAARAIRPAVAGDPSIPPELLDADHVVWRDRGAFLAFMLAHGWTDNLPPQERVGCSAHPANRRSAAAEGWAADNGFADWHRLRTLGLLG